MQKYTKQMARWDGDFGQDYTKRNMQSLEDMEEGSRLDYGLTRTEINQRFLGELDRSIRILEVGTNIGNQLLCLQKMGFRNLYGIELQRDVAQIARERTKYINFIQGSAFDVPFKDNFFDLVFTAGVLIHIAPNDIKNVMSEIHRVTKKYIWGMEYFAEKYTEVEYRGNKELLWKTDFAKLYLDTFKDIKKVKEEKFKYTGTGNVDTMFLLMKRDIIGG